MGYVIIEPLDGGDMEILGDEVGQAQARDFLKQRTGNPYRNAEGRLITQYDMDMSDKYGE